MTGVVEDPSHRHGYDRDSLMDWRKALPPRPGPELDDEVPDTTFIPGMGPRRVLVVFDGGESRWATVTPEELSHDDGSVTIDLIITFDDGEAL